MKIIKLSCENFKRLVAVEIKPDGNTVLITGKNGAGKSSVLDAIVAVLCGKKYIPKKPIREGEDHAEVVIETENWIIKRTFTEAGGGSVTITNVDGMRAQSPQGLLDKIVGEIAFDPMLFITYDERKQYEVVMKLAGLDFSDIDEQIATLKQKRSEVRSAKETYEHEAKAITVGDDVPDEEVSMVELAEQLHKVNENNNALGAKKRRIDEMKSDLADINNDISDSENSIKRLEAELATATLSAKDSVAEHAVQLKALEMLQKEVDQTEEIDPTEINTQIVMAEQTNRLVTLKKSKADLEAKAKAKTQVYAELGKEVKLCDTRKAERLAGAEMPLPGLSVTDEGVVFEGIPLSQVNDAKKLEIGMGIAMAENPELRVIRMKGNDLDEASLKIVSKMAKEKDYQVWIERWLGDESGIIIEDGSVKK